MNQFWWQKAAVYQIYPRSFMDSNGDGIGDIKGITSKLDYIRDLGTDVIWLCPVYCSPMEDNGYDISDYDHIDPMFGTDEDFDELVREAKSRGIRIVMDMVVNHCSSEHRWFQEALKDPEGKYGGYFYIRKGVKAQDGAPASSCEAGSGGAILPPNNWRSIFGGSAWERIPGTDYYYLHLFAKGQPDLNWENPELQEEIFAMMNRWLDCGISGFRMDAITYLKKEPGLPSFPPDAEDGLVSVKLGALNRPGLVEILRKLRDRTYGRALLTVGEAEGVSGDEMNDFIGLENGVFSMIFDFSFCQLNLKGPNYFWYDPRKWSPEELKDAFFSANKSSADGWLGATLECHDQPRSIDHYLPEEGRNFYGASMLAMFNLFRRGTPFIYQGEELGMRNIHLSSIDEYNDVSTKNQYLRARDAGYSEMEAMAFIHEMSRDNARIPFQWDGSENAGFTAPGVKPWLPVHPDYRDINAGKEAADPKSLLNWYRKLIRIRKDSDILVYGDFEPAFPGTEGVIAFRRTLDGREMLVALNWTGNEVPLEFPVDQIRLIADNYGEMKTDGVNLVLRPFEALCGTMRPGV